MASVVPNYARALADVVVASKLDARAVAASLDDFALALSQVPALRNVLDNPAVAQEQKLKLLDSISAQGNYGKAVRNFFAILMDKRRTALLPEIAQRFRTEINDRLGLAEAGIVTARQLSEAERQEIEARVSKMVGKKLSATYSEDAALIGGATITVGSTVYDGSVRGQLQRVKSQLAGS